MKRLRIALAFVIAHSSAETTDPAAQIPIGRPKVRNGRPKVPIRRPKVRSLLQACFEAKAALASEKSELAKIPLKLACEVACEGIDGSCEDDHHDHDPFHPGQFGNMNQNPFVVADLGFKPSKS